MPWYEIFGLILFGYGLGITTTSLIKVLRGIPEEPIETEPGFKPANQSPKLTRKKEKDRCVS